MMTKRIGRVWKKENMEHYGRVGDCGRASLVGDDGRASFANDDGGIT